MNNSPHTSEANNRAKLGNAMSATYFQLVLTAAVVDDPVIAFVLLRHERERVSWLDQATRVNAVLKALDEGVYTVLPVEADMLRLLLEHHRRLFKAYTTPTTAGRAAQWCRMTVRRCRTVALWRDDNNWGGSINLDGTDVPVGPGGFL